MIKWALERIAGQATAADTAIGRVPTFESIDTTGLDLTREQLEAAIAVEPAEWQDEVAGIEEWFAKIGDALPSSMHDELDSLKLRLGL